MKPVERKQSELLRRQGFTYREILEQVPVSKSSLSMWLRNVVLTEVQQARIHGKDLQIRRRFVEYNQRKHNTAVARHQFWENQAASEAVPVSYETLKWIGVALYWGEGSKAGNPGMVRFSNSDPNMIRLIMRWFREVCHVPEHKFHAWIQTHDDQNLEKAQDFWSNITQMPPERFSRPTVRVSRSSLCKQGNILLNGTLHVEIRDIELFHRILGWIQGLGIVAPSSSGLGRSLLRQETGVRLPVGPEMIRDGSS